MERTETIELTSNERAPLDEVARQLADISAQRTGMLLYAARLKGVTSGSVDYHDGRLVVTRGVLDPAA